MKNLRLITWNLQCDNILAYHAPTSQLKFLTLFAVQIFLPSPLYRSRLKNYTYRKRCFYWLTRRLLMVGKINVPPLRIKAGRVGLSSWFNERTNVLNFAVITIKKINKEIRNANFCSTLCINKALNDTSIYGLVPVWSAIMYHTEYGGSMQCKRKLFSSIVALLIYLFERK